MAKKRDGKPQTILRVRRVDGINVFAVIDLHVDRLFVYDLALAMPLGERSESQEIIVRRNTRQFDKGSISPIGTHGADLFVCGLTKVNHEGVSTRYLCARWFNPGDQITIIPARILDIRELVYSNWREQILHSSKYIARYRKAEEAYAERRRNAKPTKNLKESIAVSRRLIDESFGELYRLIEQQESIPRVIYRR